ncbi:MAG: hypothetical protein KGO82_09270 [Bacteroidota bacterium]|nr:hypothetical protein [Bacteroidota bacterium]
MERFNRISRIASLLVVCLIPGFLIYDEIQYELLFTDSFFHTLIDWSTSPFSGHFL